MVDEKEIANILLKIKAVTLSPDEPYTFASGIKSPIYCDNRLLMSFPEERATVTKAFLEKIKELDFEIVAGTASSAIPWAAWIAEAIGKPMVYIRKAGKGYGKDKLIEGGDIKGKKVIVIEDLISTGGSSINAVQACRDAGAIVDSCIAIFTYEMQKATDKFTEANCNIITLTNFSTLASVAVEEEYVDDKQKEIILEWNKAPADWGKKQGFE